MLVAIPLIKASLGLGHTHVMMLYGSGEIPHEPSERCLQLNSRKVTLLVKTGGPKTPQAASES